MPAPTRTPTSSAGPRRRRRGAQPGARPRGSGPRTFGSDARATTPTVAVARVVAALAVVVALTGCGLRLESGPPPLPSPGPDDDARQSAAEGAEALATLATNARATAAGPEEAALLDRVADEAARHVTALGGVWHPPAWATATPNPAEDSPAGLATVLDAFTSQTERTCRDAGTVDAAELATILASTCLAQDAARADLAAVLGDGPEPAPVGEPIPVDTLAEGLVGAAADRDGDAEPGNADANGDADTGAAALAGALDAAAFAHEVAAARASGETRQILRARAADLRSESVALLAAAGLLGTSDDPRRAAYDVAASWPEGDDAPAALAAAVEGDVLAAWTTVVGTAGADVRPGVLHRMVTAYAASLRWGAPVQPLPGLD